MFKDSHAFSSFSVSDLKKAQEFYGEVLGIDNELSDMGLELKIAGGFQVFVYQKDDHQPATFTVLNFPVEDIDKAVKDLRAKGVTFENYPEMTDETGVARGIEANMGPDIAWFKDPFGNFLSVLHDAKAN